MSLDQSIRRDVMADLQYFELRLTEVIEHLETSKTKWRIIITVISYIFKTGLEQYPVGSYDGFEKYFLNNVAFFLFGFALNTIFERIARRRAAVAESIVWRAREVLMHFNMTCDDCGRLKLMPNPIKLYDDSMSRLTKSDKNG